MTGLLVKDVPTNTEILNYLRLLDHALAKEEDELFIANKPVIKIEI